MTDEIKKQMEELAYQWCSCSDETGHNTNKSRVDVYKAAFTTCHDLMQSRTDEIKSELKEFYGPAGFKHVSEIMDKCFKLEKANRVMKEALSLVDEISSSDEFASVFQIAAIHGLEYKGKSYGEKVRQALSEVDKIMGEP